MAADHRLIVVGLGEALFDRFPHQEVLGGAPLNLATHVHAMLRCLGGQGIVASRVGCDLLGQQVCDAIAARDMDPSFIQRDPTGPTGEVHVDLAAGGSPTYRIETGAAWDRLEFTDDWQALAEQCAAVAFGTLAQRDPVSRQTIHRFLQSTDSACLRVLDLNLRQDYFDRQLIETSLLLANVLKLNAEELTVVSEMFDVDGTDADTKLRQLAKEFDLAVVALTRGVSGTRLITPAAEVEGVAETVAVTADADSVGAGDACCAGLITGLLLNWSAEDTLQLANEAGACVASRAGATPALPADLIEWIQQTQDALPHRGSEVGGS